MRLRERELDPKARRELSAVDAALRGERVDPDLDHLAAIAAELREARPALDRTVAAELDEWGASGFPRSERSPSADGRPRRPRTKRGSRGWLAPAFAGGCALLLVGLVAGLSQLPEGGRDESAVEPRIEDAGTKLPAQPPASRDEGVVAESAPSSAEKLSSVPEDRIQDESAGLTLSTEEDEVGNVTDDAALIVQRFGGIVDEQTVSSGGGREAQGRLQARIPVQNFNAALSEISDLGRVEARNQGLVDITKPYVTAEKRFADAQRRVNSLLERLAAGGEDPVLREQLRVARQRLAAARAELRANKQRGNFARVSLTVVGEDGGWSIGDAADDAVGVIEWVGGALLVSLAVAIPVGALCAALWFGSASLRRQRRERILDRE